MIGEKVISLVKNTMYSTHVWILYKNGKMQRFIDF